MRRWEYILSLNGTLRDYDYVAWFDVDNYANEPICDGYLSDFTAIRHALWLVKDAKISPMEDRKMAASYVPIEKRKIYLTGSQYAGRPGELQRMATHCKKLKEADDAKGLVAKIVDESHYLHYVHFVRFPDKILSPSYAYPPTSDPGAEKQAGPYVRRIVHGDKSPRI